MTAFIQFPWPTLPDWTPTVLKKLLDDQKEMEQRFEALAPVDGHFQVYITCNLRGCSRGLPVLPTKPGALAVESADTSVLIGGYSWEPAQSGGFTFPKYLRALLRAIGCSTRIFDSLDGRRLVPYQAVLLISEWKQVEEQFQEIFRWQRAAFRHHYGGNGAPRINFGIEPRFLGNHIPAEIDEPKMVVCTKNSFVDIIDLSELKSFQRDRSAAEYH